MQYTSRAAQLYRQQLEKDAAKLTAVPKPEALVDPAPSAQPAAPERAAANGSAAADAAPPPAENNGSLAAADAPAAAAPGARSGITRLIFTKRDVEARADIKGLMGPVCVSR